MPSKILKTGILSFLFLLIVGISTFATFSFFLNIEDAVVVPHLVTKDIVYSLSILTDLGLNTKVKGSEYSEDVSKNHVLFQDPAPGVEIKKGRDVRIIISKGAKSVLMPNLTGRSLQSARITMEENDLHEKNLSRTYSAKIKEYEIIAQFPVPGEKIERGGDVNLLISMGKKGIPRKMPDLNGLSLESAVYLIETSNMLLGKIESFFEGDRSKNIVIGQKPLPGHRVIEGSRIDFVINRKVVSKTDKNSSSRPGGYFFRYKAEHGYLKKHIKVTLNCFGMLTDIYDGFIEPGKEIWLLIPSETADLLLYENDNLILTKVSVIP